MLETDEIDQIISELKSKIEKRSEKVIYKKYRTFLIEFDMKTRNYEKLDLILKRLKKQKIIPCSKEDGELIELKHSWDLTEISIEKLEEFAKIMDKSIDTDELKKLDFIERLPVGLYSFSLLKSSDKEEETQKNCEILVYDNIKKAYSDFIRELPEFFKINKLKDKEILNENELVQLCKIIEYEYFYGCEKLPGYRIEDIKDVLRYYALYENLPQFIEFKEREKFDITNIADKIYKKDLGERARKEYLMDFNKKRKCNKRLPNMKTKLNKKISAFICVHLRLKYLDFSTTGTPQFWGKITLATRPLCI